MNGTEGEYLWWRSLTLRGRRYFWHFRSTENYEIIAQGHTRGYRDKRDCLHAIELVRSSGGCPVEERR